MRILIADDSRVLRQIVIRTPRQGRCDSPEMVEAEKGRAALEKAIDAADGNNGADGQVPDPVVASRTSDWNPPETTGTRRLRALRASGSQVSFGCVTCEGSDAMASTASKTGAAVLIARAFPPQTFTGHLPQVRDR